MRPTTALERRVFMFLNKLRLSGKTNMFGASVDIVVKFNLSPTDARKMLSLWMKNFDEKGEYKEINIG